MEPSAPTETTNGELSKTEQSALRAASEAFVLIRRLTSQPLSREGRQVIHDLADAFHNIPEYCAGSVDDRKETAFLLEAGISDAIEANKKHGLSSRHLPAKG